MHYLSDDGKVKVTCDVFELPQTDELRNFIHMKVDILGDIKITNMAEDFRLLNIATWVQQLRYKSIAYTGEGGKVVESPINLDDSFTVSGAPLEGDYPYAGVYPYKSGNNSYIVRRFEGTIGGKVVKPAVSLWGDKKGDTILMLVPSAKSGKLVKGDYFDIDLFIQPYGDEKNTYQEPVKARVDYGENSPQVTKVAKGEKLNDFPTTIKSDQYGAEFSIKGGFNYIPIIITGLSDYRGTNLYEITASGEVPVDHSKLGRDGQQVFVDENGKFGSVFLFNTDGKEHIFRVGK
jgi:hypothetical protein